MICLRYRLCCRRDECKVVVYLKILQRKQGVVLEPGAAQAYLA